MKLPNIIIILFCGLNALGQQSLPYSTIPDYPEKYTPGTVAARLVDGLGFRYYWATEGLRPADLEYKPNEDARTSLETLQHIHAMSYNLVNATRKVPSESSKIISDITFDQLRSETLQNFEAASQTLKANNEKGLEDFNLIFKGDDYEVSYPFWNLLNGPIADMLWHVGQVVSFRRSSGNPFNGNISMLTGKARGK